MIGLACILFLALVATFIPETPNVVESSNNFDPIYLVLGVSILLLIVVCGLIGGDLKWNRKSGVKYIEKYDRGYGFRVPSCYHNPEKPLLKCEICPYEADCKQGGDSGC